MRIRKILLYTTSLFLLGNCTKPSELVLNIDSKYHGWIYIIPAKVSIVDRYEVKANSSGIVYISDTLYDKGDEVNFVIKVDGKLVSPMSIKTYNISFTPRNSYLKIIYKKFYFPFSNTGMMNKEDTIYTYKRDNYNTFYMNEFEYYYTTGVIDSSIVKKWQ